MTNDIYEKEFRVGSDDEVDDTVDELRQVVEGLGSETGYVQVHVETTTKERVEANEALRELVRSRDTSD